jgi:hypothetical protein
MKPVVIAALTLFALAGVALASCSTASTSGGVSDCAAAGGQCLLGDAACAVQGSQPCGNTTVAGQFCCLQAVIEDCGQPGVITYACAAVEDGGSGCLASALALPAQQAGDEDASYPVGCAATLPSCDDGHVPECTCVSHGSPGWSCAY